MIGAGALAGYSESLRLKLRVARLEEFLRFLQAAETEIRFAGDSSQPDIGKAWRFPRLSKRVPRTDGGGRNL